MSSPVWNLRSCRERSARRRAKVQSPMSPLFLFSLLLYSTLLFHRPLSLISSPPLPCPPSLTYLQIRHCSGVSCGVVEYDCNSTSRIYRVAAVRREQRQETVHSGRGEGIEKWVRKKTRTSRWSKRKNQTSDAGERGIEEERKTRKRDGIRTYSVERPWGVVTVHVSLGLLVTLSSWTRRGGTGNGKNRLKGRWGENRKKAIS